MNQYQVLVWVGVEAESEDAAYEVARGTLGSGAYSVGPCPGIVEAGKPIPVVSLTDRTDLAD